jgi:hypothetical protein
MDYFTRDGDRRGGPYSLDEIKAMIASHRLFGEVARVPPGQVPLDTDFKSPQEFRLPPVPPGDPMTRALALRYTDAYAAARVIIQQGNFLKGGAFVVAFMILFIVVAAGERYFVSFTPFGFVLALLVGVPMYQMGVMTSAQGQILLALLDTAVNTSPVVADDGKATILGL